MTHLEGLETVGKEAYSILVQFYEYDRNFPLNARVLQREDDELYIREKIVFRGAHDSRVPGYLGIPTTDSLSYPCILLAHGVGSSKESWWKEDTDEGSLTRKLLSSGFAVLALDAQYHGERTFSNDYEPVFSYIRANLYRELLVQWTVECRLAMDYLATRSEIDIARIGILGYSLGGVMTFILTGVDPRIKAAVTCATLPISNFYIKRLGWDETAIIRMAPIAPQNFAPAIKHTPFLMLNGKTDPWGVLEEVQSLYELIGSPSKELALFESGHSLPADHIPKAVEWFRQYLK